MSDEFSTDWDLPPEEPRETTEPERRLVYNNAVDFITDILANAYMNEVNNGSEHFARVECLSRAREHLRWESATGLSTWWLHRADPHMAALTALFAS